MQSKAIELIKDDTSNTALAYSEVVDYLPDDVSGSDLVFRGYEYYADNHDTNAQEWRGVSGKVFECLIIDALWKRGISPIYYQAKVTNITYVKYDIFLYNPIRPVAISCKTSARERWKQADLEGMVLKQIYRNALSVLVTMDRRRNDGGFRVQRKIEQNEAVGLDQCVVIKEGVDTFDDLLDRIAMTEYSHARPVIPLTGTIIE